MLIYSIMDKLKYMSAKLQYLMLKMRAAQTGGAENVKSVSDNVTEEFISTEKRYVESLYELQEFLKKVNAANKKVFSGLPDQQKFRKFKNMTNMYIGNTDKLVWIHYALLRSYFETKNICQNPTLLVKNVASIAAHIMNQDEYVKLFDHFYGRHERVYKAQGITTGTNDEKDMAKFKANMMTPVQRLTRYVMLIKEYLKHNAGRPECDQALSLFGTMTAVINGLNSREFHCKTCGVKADEKHADHCRYNDDVEKDDQSIHGDRVKPS